MVMRPAYLQAFGIAQTRYFTSHKIICGTRKSYIWVLWIQVITGMFKPLTARNFTQEGSVSFVMAHLAVVEDIEPETEDPIVIPQDMVHNRATSVFPSRSCAEFYGASDTGATDIQTLANNTDAQPRSKWHESNERILCTTSRSSYQKKPPFRRSSHGQYEHDQAQRVRSVVMQEVKD